LPTYLSGPNPPLRLEPDEVQVWRIALEDAGLPGDARVELLAEAYAYLTAEERERAARMRAGAPRDEFVAGRGCLRWLLGAVVGVRPECVELELGPHGKPELAAGGVWFNVAHSRGMVLIAVSRAGEVGVDVEWVDAAIEAREIAEGSFHPLDVARIAGAAAGSERAAEFYRCWTRKEAVAKADGRGLTLALAGFATGADDMSEQTVEVPGVPEPFFVRGIEVGSGHLGALAATRAGVAVRLMDLAPAKG